MREVHLGKVKEENKLQARDLDTILGNNIFSIYLKKNIFISLIQIIIQLSAYINTVSVTMMVIYNFST